MFVGHYAASFFIKQRAPSIPLWVLLLAVQLIDVIWGILVLIGVEKVRLVPGITAASPLDLYYVPYTHSLTAVIGWSLLAFWVYFQLRGRRLGGWHAAALVGLAVFSHWVLDLLVHRPDLPLYDNSHKVGLGLWNYPAVSFPLEILLLAAAMWGWYRASGRVQLRKLIILWTIMVMSQIFTNFGPLPPSPAAFALMALAFYLAYTVAGRWCETSPTAIEHP